MLADMAARTINGTDELRSLVGEHLGYSDWVEITQEQVNQFADATGDHQWIHVDVERAKAGPFGGPIAHGYLTLSLGPDAGRRRSTASSGFSMGVNYGADKIRFPAPVPVGSKLRLGAKLLEVDRRRRRRPDDDGVHASRSRAPPSRRCVAEVLFRSTSNPSEFAIRGLRAGRCREPRARNSMASAEVGHDLVGEQRQRLGVGVVGAPRDEAAAAEVDVGLDLLA